MSWRALSVMPCTGAEVMWHAACCHAVHVHRRAAQRAATAASLRFAPDPCSLTLTSTAQKQLVAKARAQDMIESFGLPFEPLAELASATHAAAVVPPATACRMPLLLRQLLSATGGGGHGGEATAPFTPPLTLQ